MEDAENGCTTVANRFYLVYGVHDFRMCNMYSTCVGGGEGNGYKCICLSVYLCISSRSWRIILRANCIQRVENIQSMVFFSTSISIIQSLKMLTEPHRCLQVFELYNRDASVNLFALSTFNSHLNHV